MQKVGGVIVVIVILVGLKFWHRSDDSAEILADMKEVIAQLNVDEADAKYLEQMLEREHQRAFDAAYDMGGRRRRATFDEKQYLVQVLGAMAKQCDRDRSPEIADKLRTLKMIVETSDDSAGG
jgi:hypothetical protein